MWNCWIVQRQLLSSGIHLLHSSVSCWNKGQTLLSTRLLFFCYRNSLESRKEFWKTTMQSDPAKRDDDDQTESVVGLNEYLRMTEEERQKLPKARQKKLAKLALKEEKKAVKAQVKLADNETETTNKKQAMKPNKVVSQEEMTIGHFVPGQKKDTCNPFPPAYQPKLVESGWYEWWEAQDYFHVDNSVIDWSKYKGKFVMVIPPPNVTGSLHIGHALTIAIEDALARWYRMSGYLTLWVPGTDHAGIATQSVVEKKIFREYGKTRHDLGREQFVEQVWKWKHNYGDRICNQLRRMGCSVDWKREQFTLSNRLSQAVVEAFVRLDELGLVYRGTRLVNWSCHLCTALSDIEVEYMDITKPLKRKVPGHNNEVEFGWLTKFAYPVEEDSGELGERLIVATTRLETMLGDVAVAVHPRDPRYASFIGKHVIHPFLPRKLPIIADEELVDMEFGTGVVKITPAHDPNDFLCGQRHQLENISVFTDDGRINENGGPFKGMMRYDARVAIERALEEKGLFYGKEENQMRLALCSRSGDIIEPMLKPQWYIRCSEMAMKAKDKTLSGELKIVPEFHQQTWFHWLDNIRDWCVSRQLWWGHRIPAYQVLSKTEESNRNVVEERWIVGRNEEEAKKKASEKFNIPLESIILKQDEDVLDTWFSSGLFPFSVFGWPNKEERDLQQFYPTTLLETGHDILFFWVARMVMLGLTLTGELPFSTVYLHAMIRDKYGRKMSKSLGNVIDPLEVVDGATLEQLHKKLEAGNLDPKEVKRAMEGQKQEYPQGIPECGSDALRYGLLAYTIQGRDINLDVNRVAAYRNFCNKLWNATRFAILNLGESFRYDENGLSVVLHGGNEYIIDKWILSRLNDTIIRTNKAFEEYRFADAVQSTYCFWLYELCDVYLEALKPKMNSKDESRKYPSQCVLFQCLHTGLRLIHPLMPFVSEELYQRLPGRQEYENIESITIAPYPVAQSMWHDALAEEYVAFAQKIVKALRNLRAMYDVKRQSRPEMFLRVRDTQSLELGEATRDIIQTLALASTLHILAVFRDDSIPAGCAIQVVDDSCEVYLLLKGLVDFDAEYKKLEAKSQEKRLQVQAYQQKIQAPGYEKVPQEVKRRNEEYLVKYEQELSVIEEARKRFEQLLRES
ncbi:hypothetical protein GpartN1_g3793.t1 [Galdieria partita]|uniref:Valine--tRNA ligase, mitochondrial n=1 Tax=Galdieria partita TaxID=83374 RepID=A0A9C7PY44_9RHOD|nr:hypothetical protein GpartN1_g3793.t1 [Galdieria partita]